MVRIHHYSRIATAAVAYMTLASSSSQGVVHAEELCSVVPTSYSAAKTTYPNLATALGTLEQYSIAAWYTDRMSTSERSSLLSGITSKCSEDTRMTIVVYGIPSKDCDAGLSSTGAVQSTSDYQSFLQELATAMGSRKVLYVVEPDAVGLLANGGCGVAAGYLDNLKVAVKALSANSNAQLYVDVGYWLLVDASNTAKVASIINELGGSGSVKGITVNTANYRSTDEVAGYCTNFQTAMGSKDMTCIVDTSRNYHGSATSAWCNVKTAGIGKPPTSTTGVSNLDYFMWLKPPGESDGVCSDTSQSLAGTKAGDFYNDGFQSLWDQGYFVSEKGMTTISGSSSQATPAPTTTGGSSIQSTPAPTTTGDNSTTAGTVAPAGNSSTWTSATPTPTATPATTSTSACERLLVL
ncbi:hypothetical protein BBJ28_00021849 [Nothophytophthora sp. Chile5]|nr:hypothetical protein BBJ28_00021849 [Nothophytophthora sp. Chile5]